MGNCYKRDARLWKAKNGEGRKKGRKIAVLNEMRFSFVNNGQLTFYVAEKVRRVCRAIYRGAQRIRSAN